MSMSPGELKQVKVQAIRDIAVGLEARAASMTSIRDGLPHLPHVGTWTGVAADSADHEVGTFGKSLGTDAETEQGAAKKVRTAADEFEGLQQLLSKLGNDAAGKFSINDATGEVTPLSRDFNKSDRDYIAATLKQLGEAGARANDELAAAIHATDASGATSPAGAAGALPDMPGSAIKPDGSRGALQNLAAPNPDGDPGATKAAAAGTDTQANYKEWYPKNAVPGGDKNVDPSKLGGVGSIPGVRDGTDKTPQRMSPTLQAKDVPAFKDLTRQNLQRLGVPADQIEQRVNDAVEQAQTPHFLPDAPSASPSEHVSRDFGEQFNRFTNGISDSATKTVDGQIEQAKILTGQAGPGAPGVAEAWKELGLGAVQQAHELTTDPLAAPKMGIEQAKDFYNNPSEFIGKNIIHGTEALATGAIGGEAAAGARGLLGDLTGAEGRAITHGLDDATPGHHPPPVADHQSAPSQADHSAPSGDRPAGPFPPHGEPGSYGYDADGNRLPYANGGRPNFGPGQVEETWHISRDEQMTAIGDGELNLPKPGADQQWVELHPNGPRGDDWTVENDHRLIEWRPGEPRDGLWDMGHRSGEEYRNFKDEYLRGDLPYEKFIEIYRDPDNYRVQDPYRNRSHIDEGP